MLKASWGGGVRGMRLINNIEEVEIKIPYALQKMLKNKTISEKL